MDWVKDSVFVSAARAFLARHDGLVHEWDRCTWTPPHRECLRIPALDEDGFDLEVHPDPEEVTIFVGGGVHFHTDASTPEEIDESLAFLHDLLSPGVRLHVRYAGGSPYRWRLEVFDGEKWRARKMGALLIFNFLGRRSTRTLQNRHLPARTGR